MLKKLALITLMGMSASAAMAGDWQVKVGGSLVDPTGNTKLNGTTKVEADYQYAFTPSVEYFFNDNFSTELLLATPIKHDIKANGTNIGSIKQLPPTLTFKYTFANSSPFTPYVGVGATGFFAWGVQGDTIKKVKNDVGVAGQIGVNFQPADAKNWGVFADVRYADLDPKVRLNDGNDTEFKLKIDPVIYTLGYSYRF
ncbi:MULTISPECIES: OmpW/AlkL family protein [unclassified Acinetobacter]|uniref:OmpW/AlkL family protein n=1 Tax=unclassified Acinetobacter TaxID=196816 RepID=UPI002934E64F|nr:MULTISPECIES: OmpW family outer membrane protein [unclassified Acinetobacter]WOE31102.1 OmpW family outer membrane protein [Acinetobacter sp. SAAs470]WOE39298.1 OmpW family outer membrane protein [Acinetobacter sp. SAAs474]